jgi:pimeloyl-ACP methyl ester carboxylesterase
MKASGDFHHQQITVDGVEIHAVEAGSKSSPRTFLFLHGWPEDASEFGAVQALASQEARTVAIDLPGIGASRTAPPSGVKSAIAPLIVGVIKTLSLENVTLVGHDAGGMVAYACLRRFPERFRSVVILSTVIPGLPPWEDVIRNPYMFHFAFHAVPHLPELLVQDRQGAYFDYFFQAIAARPEAITPEARQRYVAAYASTGALKAGFDWYRTFAKDAEENGNDKTAVELPLLYVRGDKERGEMQKYLEGFRQAGIARLSSALIPNSGHFTPEEQPEAVWQALRAFVNSY